MRVASVLISVLAVVAMAPSNAAADGLPLPVEDLGPTGVLSPDGAYRYVTVKSGPDTVLERIQTDGGQIRETVRLEGEYTIPAVALDGSPGGLSADGSTLVLISPRQRFPRETTEFIRFDTDDLRSPHPVELKGDFSFDALSPDGRTMYLIHYTDRRDPTKYHVRAYDLEAGRLLPGRISDPEEADREMFGYAVSRVTSADGRWAYTLYWGAEHPFIHALDLVNGAAECIDVEGLPRKLDMWLMRLQRGAGGSYLTISELGRGPLATVDPTTHAVGQVPSVKLAAAVARGGSEPPAPPTSGPWIGVGAVGLGLGLAALAGFLAVRRRPRALAS